MRDRIRRESLGLLERSRRRRSGASLLEQVLALASWEHFFWASEDLLALSGTDVTSWTNLGAGSAATPATTSPNLVTASNGKQAVRFNGTADQLVGTFASTYDTDDGLELFVVATKASGITDAYFDSGPGATTNSGALMFSNSGGIVTARVIANNVSTGALSSGDWHLFNFVNLGNADRRMRLDGSEVDSDTTARQANLVNFRIGALLGNIYFTDADIAFIGMTSGTLSDAVRDQIEALLAAEYVP